MGLDGWLLVGAVPTTVKKEEKGRDDIVEWAADRSLH